MDFYDPLCFNLNFIRHQPDEDVKIILSEIIKEITIEEEAQLLIKSSHLSTNDGNITITNLDVIKMPPPVRVRGRPKGEMTTVIGRKKASSKPIECQTYQQMKSSDWEKFVLKLCIGPDSCEKVKVLILPSVFFVIILWNKVCFQCKPTLNFLKKKSMKMIFALKFILFEFFWTNCFWRSFSSYTV